MKARGAVSTLAIVAALSGACGPVSTEADALAMSDAGATEVAPAPLFVSLPAPPPTSDTDAQRALGRLLFHDPLLSSDRSTACATCHSPYWGMADGRQRAAGVGANGPVGPARVGGTPTRRNAISLWNAAYRSSFFWDGRAASLEEQALGPLTAADELNRDGDELVRDLRSIPAYVALFREAFPDESEPTSLPNVQRAIASFVRTFVSNRAPYDDWAAGQADAMNDAEVRGLRVFAAAGCARCHAPPRFESDAFYRVLDDPSDPGRAGHSGDANELHAFRVPSLRNVHTSAPYFHDGRAPTLEAVLDAKARAGLAPTRWTERERQDLLEFLRYGLLDRSRERESPGTVPSGLAVPLNDPHSPRRP